MPTLTDRIARLISQGRSGNVPDRVTAAGIARLKMEWLPIESAPKDGTPILVAGGTRTHPDSMITDELFGGVAIAFWNTHWKQWDGEQVRHDDCYCHEPTHWMPLPEPPAFDLVGVPLKERG